MQRWKALDALRGLAPLGVTGADGATAVSLIAAIRQSIAEDTEISFSEPEFHA